MTKPCRYVLAACLLATGVAHAQQFHFGVRGGLIPTTPTRTYTKDESRRYLVGPVFEMRWGRLALDVSLLYQRLGHGQHVRFGPGIPDTDFSVLHQSDVRTRANAWQLPIVGKFYFREDGKWQPFLGTGYALQRAWVTTEGASVFSYRGETTTNVFKTDSRASNIGAIAAAGVQFRYGRIIITPEVRYIRWGGTEDSRFPLNPNQVQATVGITF